jgi:hypothetical protein
VTARHPRSTAFLVTRLVTSASLLTFGLVALSGMSQAAKVQRP